MKIGFTIDIEGRRFAAIAAASPVPIIMVAHWQGSTRDEADAHWLWRDQRCSDIAGREWFHQTPGLMAWAAASDQFEPQLAL